MHHPTPEQIKLARQAAGHDQKKAAQTVHRAAQQRWSEWEAGVHRMDPAIFELYLIKTGQASPATEQATHQ